VVGLPLLRDDHVDAADLHDHLGLGVQVAVPDGLDRAREPDGRSVAGVGGSAGPPVDVAAGGRAGISQRGPWTAPGPQSAPSPGISSADCRFGMSGTP
jgi:hypothetical protein